MRYIFMIGLSSLILLTGCHNNKKVSLDDENGSITLKGQVIGNGGEIAGANIFLDLNKNFSQDENEPSVTSNSRGYFELKVSSQQRKNPNYIDKTALLIANSGKSIRTDRDFSDSMSALIDEKERIYITPFSSLISQWYLQAKKSDDREPTQIVSDIKSKASLIFGINDKYIGSEPIQSRLKGDKNYLKFHILLSHTISIVSPYYDSNNTNIKSLKLYSYLADSLDNNISSNEDNLTIFEDKLNEFIDSSNKITHKDSARCQLQKVTDNLSSFLPSAVKRTYVISPIQLSGFATVDYIYKEAQDRVNKTLKALNEIDIDKITNNPSTSTIGQGDLSTIEALRFLNKATFGASIDDINHLKSIGYERWIEEQFNIPAEDSPYLRTMIDTAKMAEPLRYPCRVDEYLADNDKVFNKNDPSSYSMSYWLGSWYRNALNAKDQLRHKVAYALSQIIVESDFEPIFRKRSEALARYYDILYQNAFGSYKKLLYDITLNSGMSLYLTYNGNKKHYKNGSGVDVYPDENYGREIMQLFSIGLNKLNIDGTPILDKNGNPTPTYTQNDVNEITKVFTGWDLKRNKRYGAVGYDDGDFTHPIEFNPSYHDSGEKKFLSGTIPAGLSGEDDIKSALDILFAQSSLAPYISKKLIMRLTKSNPSPSYIQRVATAFINSDYSLKELTRAIFLDPELLNDLKNNTPQKFKEPQIAMTQLLRAMHVSPLPKWYFCIDNSFKKDECQLMHDTYLFKRPTDYLGQGAGLSPTVFNFYDDEYIPVDDNFQAQHLVAPELQIQTDLIIVRFSNKIREYLRRYERYSLIDRYYHTKNGFKQFSSYEELIGSSPPRYLYSTGDDKFMIDASDEYNLMESIIDGDIDGDFKNLADKSDENQTKNYEALRALIEFENIKLTGGLLSDKAKDAIFNALKDKMYDKHLDPLVRDRATEVKRYQLYKNVIVPTIRAVATSSEYMVE